MLTRSLRPCLQTARTPAMTRRFRFPSTRISTGDRVVAYCKEQHYKHDIDVLRIDGFPEVRLHTLSLENSAKSKGILVYFHGGGYTHPASLGHFRLCDQMARRLSCSKICMLEYSLLPEAKYPTQLAQAAETMRFLLEKHQAHHLSLGGDSAGGNLLLGLLAHINSPHPEIAPVKLDAPLSAAFCISPRCSNDTSALSFDYNAKKDVITRETVKTFVSSWRPVQSHVWAAPNEGGRAFWGTRNAIHSKKLFIVAGENECYIDDIRRFGELVSDEDSSIEESTTQFELAVAKDSVHVQTIIDLAKGNSDGRVTKALFSWAEKSTNPGMKAPDD